MKKAGLMAGHSTTAVWPFCISALLKWYVGNVPFAKAGSAGPAANVLLPVSSTKKYICPRLSRPPYVCNGCPSRNKCSLEKHLYQASYAQKEYELVRSESRAGFALSPTELKQMDDIVSPLLIKGQSLHHIAVHHADELMKSERTLYAYVNNGLFTARNLDMPRTVRMRPRKNVSRNLKVDKACREGRDFSCFQAYTKEHPDLSVRQIDSVEGLKGGAVLLTIHFVEQELQLAFLRKRNDSQSVIDIFNRLYLELRPDIFMELFPLLLADNGSEFSNPSAIECDSQGKLRTRMFYCNASAPYQKGSCENNHEMIRRIIPKGEYIGQYTQEQIDLMMSHINSYARKKLGNKSPYEVFEFQYGKKCLDVFHLCIMRFQVRKYRQFINGGKISDIILFCQSWIGFSPCFRCKSKQSHI